MYKELLKLGIRFHTSKGMLTLENLVRLNPSESNADFLEKIALDLKEKYEDSKPKSLRGRKTTKDKTLKLQYDVVVDLLNDMDATLDANSTKKGVKEELDKLLAIDAEKDEEALKNLSDAERKRRIKELSKQLK